ncbi:TPA: 30S ribosomal protein S16 [Candidatus Saccharibacteria bacterium]|nr:30S ribosomal protein S16 [Candidatus Saccharibacteria bacterium]HIO87502.1 30S ribosomal protein S16 [Candidatus Saccharibacteria bacterium]
MLALRLQRVGRKKLAQYRLIAQEHSLQPTSGKVAAYLGSYDPHTKKAQFKKDEIEKYLGNGAQPSNRVAILLKKEGIKLPDWVVIETKEPKKVETEESEAAEEAATPEEAPAQEESKAEEPAETKESKPEDEEKAE